MWHYPSHHCIYEYIAYALKIFQEVKNPATVREIYIFTMIYGSYTETEGEGMYYTQSVTSKSGLNILGLLVFSIAFGVILGGMGEEGKPLKDFFNCLSEASMRLVNLIIW